MNCLHIVVPQGSADSRERIHIAVKDGEHSVPVGRKNLLPHDGRRTRNAGDVLKAAGCERAHGVRLVVRVLHEVYERSRNEMREMGNRCDRAVVGRGVNHIRVRKHTVYERFHSLAHLRARLGGRAEQIKDVFEEQGIRIDITALFGTGHRVTSHELRAEAEAQHFPFYALFAAADIGNQCVGRENIAERSEIAAVGLHRRAEKHRVTVGEAGLGAGENAVYRTVRARLFQHLPRGHVGINLTVRLPRFQCLCDGTSDESETDETVSHM